ncbi:hypothetical protein NPIL_655881, partial [Nephila pilipes]
MKPDSSDVDDEMALGRVLRFFTFFSFNDIFCLQMSRRHGDWSYSATIPQLLHRMTMWHHGFE